MAAPMLTSGFNAKREAYITDPQGLSLAMQVITTASHQMASFGQSMTAEVQQQAEKVVSSAMRHA